MAASNTQNGSSGKDGRNPPWRRDELILALDVYLNDLQRRMPTGPTDPAVIELIARFRRLPLEPERHGDSIIRTGNSICFKLGNFRALDPNVDRAGFGNYSRLDREIWQEFAGDPEAVHAAARDILDTLE